MSFRFLLIYPLFFLLLFPVGCTRSGTSRLPGTGLSLASDARSVRWELYVGILNDEDLPPLSKEKVKQRLEAAAREVEGLLPGIKLKFIIDQPLAAGFMMDRVIHHKKNKPPLRSDSSNSLLLLEPGASARGINVKKLKSHGLSKSEQAQVLNLLKSAQSTRTVSGKPLLYDKSAASGFEWHRYMSAQVRYDLTLTNSFIFRDDLGASEPGVAPGNAIRWQITDSPGRSALDGRAGFFSAYSLGAGSGPGWSGLKKVLLGLVLPAGPEFFKKNAGKLQPGPETRISCPNCEKNWVKRLSYFKGLIALNRGQHKKGCGLIQGYMDDLNPVVQGKEPSAWKALFCKENKKRE